MREEVISSGGPVDHTPAASSVGASSPAVPTNINSLDWSCHGQNSKAASISCIGSQPPWTTMSTSANGSALGSSRPSCRPWERGDLLRRLATFKPSNWFGKPKVASSLACAQRGWINIDVNQIKCETCGACLSSISSPSWTPAEAEDAGEAFSKQLDIGHKAACPWRGSSCPESLAQFPPTPQSALIGGYKDRCDGLSQFQSLPLIAASAIEKMQISRGPQIDRLLSQFHNLIAGDSESVADLEFPRDGSSFSFSQAQKLISLCGWEPRWLPNVQDCEEHSAQSARNGYSFGPSQAQIQDHGPSRNTFSSAKKDTGKNKMLAVDSRSEFRSSMLDCSLCGAIVRISNFLTILRPTRLAPNNVDIPSKILGLTRGGSAASGINGWVPTDDPEKDQTVDRDEVATTGDRKLLPNAGVDLNLTMAGGFSFTHEGRTSMAENIHDAEDMGRDLMIAQPAASYESRGPISHKRSLEIGGSSDNRENLRIQHADSIEGSVIDRDGDECSAGPGPSTKRARESDTFSGAGPSHSSAREQIMGIPSTRGSTRASSVIAMNIACHSDDDDSMDSVENHPGGNVDEVHFPSSSTHGNLNMNETSGLNYSNQAQQSIHLREAARSEIGVGSTNDGDEIFNMETTVTAQRRGAVSFGMSGCSVGMCASHEAEIHGNDVYVQRTNSVVGDVETRIEDNENQGQTGESAPDPCGDSQEMLSRSIGRADSASKVDGADSVESGEKASESCKLNPENSAQHPSLSCNANIYSGYETTNKEVTKGGKSSSINNCPYPEPDYAMANGIGPPKGGSNYGDVSEFDPIVHHNKFCPWVNGNVAAAGCSSPTSGSSADAVALCGWQLTLDALDVLRTQGNMPLQTGQSESAASLYKDDHKAPSQKLQHMHSTSKSHGQH